MAKMRQDEVIFLITQHFGKYGRNIGVIESATLEWDWGILCYVQSKEYIDSGQNPIIGLSPVLIDKIDRTTHSIDYLKVLDIELEAYRESKNYPISIKFPPKYDTSKMSPLDKVFALFSTSEISQINVGIELVKENNLFSLYEFGLLCHAHEVGNLEKSIAKYFNTLKKGLMLHGSSLVEVPNLISLFRKSWTSITIMNSAVRKLPDSILDLEILETITVDASPLETMPYDLRPLRQLKSVELRLVSLSEHDKIKFKLPAGCNIEITQSTGIDHQEILRDNLTPVVSWELDDW